MKLHPVPARTGLEWARLGIRTFWRQPLALGGLFFLFMLVVSLLAVVPVLGQLVALALLPAATLGLMSATREAHDGRFPMPVQLIAGLRSGPQRTRSMLVLGVVYALGSLAVMGLSGLLLGDTPLTPGSEETELTEALLQQPEVLRSMAVSMLLYLPLGLLFWHAPALVHWHGVSPGQSLFFSAMACWTNKGALLVYFLAWTGVFLGVSLAVVMLAMALGGAQVLATLVFPVAMLMSAMFFASLYFTFRDSFLTDDGQAVA